jgi:hypothetical protein
VLTAGLLVTTALLLVLGGLGDTQKPVDLMRRPILNHLKLANCVSLGFLTASGYFFLVYTFFPLAL